MKSILLIFLGFFVASLGISSLFFDQVFILNLAVAYISTSLVVTLSFYGYYRQLPKDHSTQEQEIVEDDKYDYDQFYGDKHDLLSDERIDEHVLQDGAKDEKPARFSLANLQVGSKIFFSFYRIVAYIVLVIALVWLIDNSYFDPWGYLSGVVINTFAVLSIIIKWKNS